MRRRPRIALATCRALPEPDPDQEPLLAALRGLGAEASLVAWDDSPDGLDAADLCVIRSTWDYVHRLEDYRAWARAAAARTRLLNPLDVVLWNTDKSYLRDLEARGVRVVPTAFADRGSRPSLTRILAERGWDDVVLKPRVGAASFATRRFRPGEAAGGEEYLAAQTAERDMLVQPYMNSVEAEGESALVWIAGQLSHAVRKAPRWAGAQERVHDRVSRAPSIPAEEREFALRALAPWARDLLYARVDLVRDDDGGLRLMELELVEPSLFLLQHPPALELFARSCVAAAG